MKALNGVRMETQKTIRQEQEQLHRNSSQTHRMVR